MFRKRLRITRSVQKITIYVFAFVLIALFSIAFAPRESNPPNDQVLGFIVDLHIQDVTLYWKDEKSGDFEEFCQPP